MGLIKCNECDAMLSEKATSCPHCGVPLKRAGGGCLRLIGLLAILWFVISIFSGSNNTKPATSAIKQTERPEQVISKYLVKLDAEILSLAGYSLPNKIDDMASIKLQVAKFNRWAKTIDNGNHLELSKADSNRLEKFASDLSTTQQKALPKLRDSLGPVLRKMLWEDDITAKTTGSGFKRVEFVGGTFAANRNIKKFQKSVSGTLSMLRFSESRYRWYEGENKYTYYKLTNPSDRKIAIWNDYSFDIVE